MSRPGIGSTLCSGLSGGESSATTPDNAVNLQSAGGSGVEASLDFPSQPGVLLGVTLLMLDGGRDSGRAIGVGSLSNLHGQKVLEFRS